MELTYCGREKRRESSEHGRNAADKYSDERHPVHNRKQHRVFREDRQN